MTSVFIPLITGTYWQTFLLVCLFSSWLSSHMKWVFWCEPNPGMVLIDLINQTLRGFQESCVFVRNTVFLIGIAESCCAHNCKNYPCPSKSGICLMSQLEQHSFLHCSSEAFSNHFKRLVCRHVPL